MSTSINKISADLFPRHIEKRLRYIQPTLTNEITIILDTPQNWEAGGNVISASAGDVIYVPFGNAYTHASATVRQLPEDNTRVSAGYTTGNVDDSNTKYIFGTSRINSIEDLPDNRGAYVEIGTVGSTPLETGDTAVAGGSNTITLAASSSSVDDAYNGAGITITSGTGSGQTRTIRDYNGSTKVATLRNNWDTTPDNTSVYDIANGTILIEGGDNLVCIGSDFTAGVDTDRDYAGNRACVRAFNQKYSAYFENCVLDANQTYGRDIIEYGATNVVSFIPDIYIQNCLTINADSEFSKPDDPTNFIHADIMQPYGKHRFVFIDRMTGSTQYQGGFDDPQIFGLDRVYSNINFRYLDNSDPDSVDAGFLIYFKNFSSLALTQMSLYNFHIENIYVQNRDFYSLDFASSSVFPQEDSQIIGSSGYVSNDEYTGIANGSVSFPSILGVYGSVKQSSDYGGAIFGDYVVRDRDAGAGVRVLGKDDTRSFYHKTDDCQVWLMTQQFYSMNSSTCDGVFGSVDITSIQDTSHSYNHMTATNVKYLTRSHYGRKVIEFNGDGYVSTGLTSMGNTSLFADSSDAFFVYVVAQCDTDGYIFSKSGSDNHIGLYVDSGVLYGVCRGSVTVINDEYDGSMVFIGIDWDGSSLYYWFNNTKVMGSVGTLPSETSQNIIWGAKDNGSSSYFDGTIWGSRVYDRSLIESEIEELFYYENLYANLLGHGDYRPSTPSQVRNVLATPSSNQIAITFDAPSSNGGSPVLDYVVRYSTDQVNWSFWQLTTVSDTTGVTITGLSSSTTYYYEIYPANVSGWGDVYKSSTTTT